MIKLVLSSPFPEQRDIFHVRPVADPDDADVVPYTLGGRPFTIGRVEFLEYLSRESIRDKKFTILYNLSGTVWNCSIPDNLPDPGIGEVFYHPYFILLQGDPESYTHVFTQTPFLSGPEKNAFKDRLYSSLIRIEPNSSSGFLLPLPVRPVEGGLPFLSIDRKVDSNYPFAFTFLNSGWHDNPRDWVEKYKDAHNLAFLGGFQEFFKTRRFFASPFHSNTEGSCNIEIFAEPGDVNSCFSEFVSLYAESDTTPGTEERMAMNDMISSLMDRWMVEGGYGVDMLSFGSEGDRNTHGQPPMFMFSSSEPIFSFSVMPMASFPLTLLGTVLDTLIDNPISHKKEYELEFWMTAAVPVSFYHQCLKRYKGKVKIHVRVPDDSALCPLGFRPSSRPPVSSWKLRKKLEYDHCGHVTDDVDCAACLRKNGAKAVVTDIGNMRKMVGEVLDMADSVWYATPEVKKVYARYFGVKTVSGEPA